MKVHLDQLAGLLLVFLASVPVAPGPAESQRPDPIIGRLKSVDSFAFGGIGFVLATSQGEFDYRAILSRKSAAVDFETVFRIGNPQAKCYALVGLRQINGSRFESLATPLQSSRICVAVTRGCVTFNHSMTDVVKQIRSGAYSGPITHDLVPPLEAAKPHITVQEQTTWKPSALAFLLSTEHPRPTEAAFRSTTPTTN